MMKIMLRTFATLALVASTAACDLDVPDLNNPGLDDLSENPTRSKVLAAATGLLIGNRIGYSAANGYVSHLGIIGRESYNFDAADPRYITELLASAQLDPGSGAFGGNFWNAPYANIRSGHTLLHALDVVLGMTDAEKEATRGFAKTIQALDFLIVLNTRDVNGAPIDVDRPIEELAPIATKAEVQAHILLLLDEAKAHLAAGGDVFPFKLSSGFAGFDTPATFLKFNRAIKARVDIYAGNFDAALVDLTESFISSDPLDPKLNVGVYYSYGTGSGDVRNGLIDPNLFAHPSIVTDADLKVNGDIDDRVTRKIVTVESRTVQGLTSDKGFTMYQETSAPTPLIRNEELILLRAEANIGLGNLAVAADDINFVRVSSGGLAPRLDLVAGNILAELLKQKRYSLLFEGGHRWIDLRRYDLLDTLPIDVAGHVVHRAFPLPISETDPR